MNLVQSESTKSSESINPSLPAFPPPAGALFNYGFSKVNDAVPAVVPIPTFNNLGATSIFARSPLEVSPHGERGVRVASEAWLLDSIEKQEAQPLEAYDIVTDLAVDGKGIPWDKQLKLYGKRGVYKDTGLQKQGGQIFEEPLMKSGPKVEAVWSNFSQRWFTVMHSFSPFIFRDYQELADHAAASFECVRDIVVASHMIGHLGDDTLDEKNGCSIPPLHTQEDHLEIFFFQFW
ncbi:hypothetical protein GOBAR_DD27541 [Gossypium barbadense]|nr:hypothetical protein GOBAR_DD27541 [Gossypium barbadense]